MLTIPEGVVISIDVFESSEVYAHHPLAPHKRCSPEDDVDLKDTVRKEGMRIPIHNNAYVIPTILGASRWGDQQWLGSPCHVFFCVP